MVVNIVSDIHIEHFTKRYPIPEIGVGDILILAGDIFVADYYSGADYLDETLPINKFFKECKSKYNKIIYILGNHEYYYSDIKTIHQSKYIEGIKKICPNIEILDNNLLTVSEDWVILGSTLWTNFTNKNPLDLLEVQSRINDYRYIYTGDKRIIPEDISTLNLQSFKWLKNSVENLRQKNIIIITHHAPSYKSTHQRYYGSRVNIAYSNNYDKFIEANKNIKYWIHGHTHNKFNYFIGECEVICNPMGYVSLENTGGYFPRQIVL